MQSDQLEEIREQWRVAQEYNKENDKKFDSLERYCFCNQPSKSLVYWNLAYEYFSICVIRCYFVHYTESMSN